MICLFIYATNVDGLILELLKTIQSVLLVSLGAVLGSNIRLLMFQTLEGFIKRKEFRILFINNFASFFLGLFFSLFSHNSFKYSYQLGLLFCIGLIGSLSTFSTFMYDLFDMLKDHTFFKVIKQYLLSVSFALLSFWIGFCIGY